MNYERQPQVDPGAGLFYIIVVSINSRHEDREYVMSWKSIFRERIRGHTDIVFKRPARHPELLGTARWKRQYMEYPAWQRRGVVRQPERPGGAGPPAWRHHQSGRLP